MNSDFAAAMRRAALSTRAGDLDAATRTIQEALAGRSSAAPQVAASIDITPPPEPRPALRLVEANAQVVEPAAEPAPFPPDLLAKRQRRPLGEVLRTLREGKLAFGASNPLPGMKRSAAPAIPDGAQFLTRSFTCAAGTRSYKLYIPASAAKTAPRGLVVMLHGCKQDPDDFAAGTDMNAVAEANGLLVAYPGQTGSANASSCWNWFNPADQMRDAGEPSIIAGITREVMTEWRLGRTSVFVAGLSAGGAMAAVMGETYPDLYAGVGIHSGLAYRSANDVMSAFAAMRGSAAAGPGNAPSAGPRVRTIVFHGSADNTVHPANAERIVAAAQPRDGRNPVARSSGSSSGRAYTRTTVRGGDGVPAVELWLLEGAGHAWSGGRVEGSYADPQGPDASAEMVRFFLEKPADAG